LYGTLDASGRFDYCRAGHPHPIVLDENRRRIDTGTGPGMPLGFMEASPLDARLVTIPPGGLALVYSDGLNEARNASGDEFGDERLASVLPALSHLTAEGVCAGLWKQVQEFSGSEPQSDDFTVVVIKRSL
jgi:sigma-B regulation protein RsbU (phosphoserine phosphatase)